jgi:hypothetical protein
MRTILLLLLLSICVPFESAYGRRFDGGRLEIDGGLVIGARGISSESFIEPGSDKVRRKSTYEFYIEKDGASTPIESVDMIDNVDTVYSAAAPFALLAVTRSDGLIYYVFKNLDSLQVRSIGQSADGKFEGRDSYQLAEGTWLEARFEVIDGKLELLIDGWGRSTKRFVRNDTGRFGATNLRAEDLEDLKPQPELERELKLMVESGAFNNPAPESGQQKAP